MRKTRRSVTHKRGRRHHKKELGFFGMLKKFLDMLAE